MATDLSAEWFSFLLVVLTAPLLPALHLLLLRLSQRIPALPVATLVHAALLVGGLRATHNAEPRQLLLVSSLLLTLALGYLQFVSMATRSISLRLLVELAESPDSSAEELFRDYAAGRGFAWLLEKRLTGLEATGLIRRREGVLFATALGRLLGRAGRRAKAALALEGTG